MPIDSHYKVVYPEIKNERENDKLVYTHDIKKYRCQKCILLKDILFLQKWLIRGVGYPK
jgi:hypothetical protein